MFVENLNEKMINDLAFEMLKVKAHKQPKNSIDMHKVVSYTKSKDFISFEIEYDENNSDITQIMKVEATDYEVAIDCEYNHSATHALRTFLDFYFYDYMENLYKFKGISLM